MFSLISRRTHSVVTALTAFSVTGSLSLASGSAIEFVGPRDADSLIAMYGGNVSDNVIYVKLRDDCLLRVQQNGLDTLPGANASVSNELLASLQSLGAWTRGHHVDDAELERQRQVAIKNCACNLPDLRQECYLTLSDGHTLRETLDHLNSLTNLVEIALPHVKPVASPTPPDYRTNQRYLNAATDGISVSQVWSWPGGRGENVRICDVEYSWNTAHLDLPVITRLGPVPVDPFTDNNHGTAVLGEMFSRDNGWGTVGSVSDGAAYIAAAYTASGYNPAGAITTATAGLRAGDVILIEQQTAGPNGSYVPTEWLLSVYNAVRQSVLNNVHVVEAAGNGGQNLDSSIFNVGHRPFIAANDSGAIIVGAGCAPASAGGSSTDRSRLTFSCYGSTVDLQGWGERVTTSGYGTLYSSEGVNAWYTAAFNGTSSASPIVAGAVASLQGLYKRANNGATLSPSAMRTALRDTGSPQQGGANPVTQTIGPRPSVIAAAWQVFGATDCNNNQRPDILDIASGESLDANSNFIPDECDGPVCDSIDFNNDTSIFDPQDIDAFLSVYSEGPCIPDTATCSDIDFNNDGSLFDPCDIDAFLLVFSEGPCTLCGN